MPTISTPTLTLTDVGPGVVVQVRYTATFSRFDRQLAGLGKTWHSHVTIHDFDGGGELGDVILDFGAPDDRERFAVTVGNSDQAFTKTEQVTVINQGIFAVDADGVNELKAQVRLHSPQTVEEFTEGVVSVQQNFVL